MGRKRMPGLALRGGAWHIDKVVFGRRIRQSTGAIHSTKRSEPRKGDGRCKAG